MPIILFFLLISRSVPENPWVKSWLSNGSIWALSPAAKLWALQDDHRVLERDSHSTESLQVSGKGPSIHVLYQQNLSSGLSDPFGDEIFHRRHLSSGKQWGQVRAAHQKRHTGIKIQAQCHFKKENK